jgi:diguanylate cyclase (GGDEF)-like protein
METIDLRSGKRDVTMRKTIKASAQWVGSQDPRYLLIVLILLIVMFGYLDYLSGYEVSISLLYLLPIGLAAWFIGKRSALILSILSAVAWIVSNTLAGQTYSNPLIGYWNTLIQFGFFLVVSGLILKMRASLRRETEASNTDSLTGLMNSRAFYRQATTELLRARRYQRPFSLAYIDVDNFKQVNDRHGHMTGDQLLRTVADTLRTRLRSTDLIARLGGDEFVAFLPETEFHAGTIVITKLHESLIKAMDRHHWKVTFSTGAVTFHKYGMPLKEVIQQADQLMVQAKAGGKNAVRFETVE